MDGHVAAKLIKGFRPDLSISTQSAYALEHQRARYEGAFYEFLNQKVLKYIDIKME